MLASVLARLWSSAIGRLFVIALMAAFWLVAGYFGLKILNRPGPVSAAQLHGESLGGYHSHAEFEKECKHCHAPLHCIDPDNCQECHYEVAKQRARAVGLHGVLPGTARCQTCHVEHRGRDAVISDVPLQNVDHRALTGFSLERHLTAYDGAEFACRDCHRERFAADGVDCVTCHADHDPDYLVEHVDQYGDRCFECHDGRDRMNDFQHDTVYILDGAHATAGCEDCHVEKSYAGTPADCSDCHPEPELHAGSFGLNCARCHSAVAWAPAQFTLHTFLVQAGAGDVSCEVCHVETYTEYPCFSCHDAGEMQIEHQKLQIESVEDCVDCHPTGPGQRASEIARSGLSGMSSAPAGSQK